MEIEIYIRDNFDGDDATYHGEITGYTMATCSNKQHLKNHLKGAWLVTIADRMIEVPDLIQFKYRDESTK